MSNQNRPSNVELILFNQDETPDSDDDGDDNGYLWKKMTRFMLPTTPIWPNGAIGSLPFPGSALLKFMWHQWPHDTALVKDTLLLTALRSPKLSARVRIATLDQLPFLWYQTLFRAAHTNLLQKKLFSQAKLSISQQGWSTAERSSKLLQLALPGLPVDKALLAQLMNKQQQANSQTPTSIMIIQSLLDSYKDVLAENSQLAQDVLPELERRFNAIPQMTLAGSAPMVAFEVSPLPSRDGSSDDEATVDEQLEPHEVLTCTMHEEPTCTLGTWGRHDGKKIDQWISHMMEVLRLLDEDPSRYKGFRRKLAELITQHIMVKEVEIVAHVCGQPIGSVEAACGLKWYIKRPIKTLSWLEDMKLLSELMDMVIARHSVKNIVRVLFNTYGVRVKDLFTPKFFQEMQDIPGLATEGFRDILLRRLTEFDRIWHMLNSQRRHFDREVSWVLKMVLTSLSQALGTQKPQSADSPHTESEPQK